MKRSLFIVLSLILIAAGTFSTAEEASERSLPLPVKVLLLPKFEIGEMAGDFPGEAQYYYEQYLMGAGEYDIPYSPCKLYYKDGVAMCVQGMGKINAALSTMAILSDARFDYLTNVRKGNNNEENHQPAEENPCPAAGAWDAGKRGADRDGGNGSRGRACP